jgi:hypothetical protein
VPRTTAGRTRRACRASGCGTGRSVRWISAALAALADVFYPRVFLRRAFRVPAGTVSMTVYFHADAEMLRAVGSDFVLGQARGQFYHAGYFDQTAQLWSRDGVPLASSTQVVYYKE